MKVKQYLLMGCILTGLFVGALAELSPSEWAEPVKVTVKSPRARDFQQIIEKFFGANGRLLMPLGFFSATSHIHKTDEMKKLVKNGITFIHRYTGELFTAERFRREIYGCAKAGLPLALNLPKKSVHRDMAWWENFLQSRDLVNQKQIILWYLPEEPELEDLPRLRQLTEWLHKHDKLQRPVMTYLKNSNQVILTEASKFMDCLAYGAYPGAWGIRTRVAYRIDLAYKCGAPAVIAVLEAFKTRTGWTDPRHIEFDGYLALIHGAKGLWWYSYHQIRQKPELLNAVLDLTRILNGPEYLGEVFLKGEDNQNIKARIVDGPKTFFSERFTKATKRYLSGKPSVHWRAYNHRGKIYLVMVNCCETPERRSYSKADEEALTVKIRFQGFDADSKIALLDGESEYSYGTGLLTVTLKPLGVAVFKITSDRSHTHSGTLAPP